MDSRDWHALPGPTWYRPAEAAAAAGDLAKSASADDAASAVRRLVDAVGNDHAGTLYPAAVPAVQKSPPDDLPTRRRREAASIVPFRRSTGCASLSGHRALRS
ncbi:MULTISPECIES: hypothetical protein [Amycolatopsis]|uniref:Uncharacterized protein n=1 Tax=Amycolatopsis albidoflavus TaxID=102226 RepID=A0ABW5HXE8_9PSEU